MKKVSIIIVTHDQLTMVSQCMANLAMSTLGFADKEIIVVDNASPHPEAIKNICIVYKARYMRNDRNLSFSMANHEAIEKAKGEWVLLLNDDTVPNEDGWLDVLMKFSQEKPKAAVIGCKLTFPNGTVQHAGVYFNQYRQPHHLFSGTDSFDPRTNVPRECQAVTFACALIKKSAYKEVGGFSHTSEEPGYHYEDVDLCMKVKKAGHEVWYCPEARVIHYSAMSYRSRPGGGQPQSFLPKFIEKWFIDIEHDDWKIEIPPHNPVVAIGIPLADNCRWRFRQLMNMIDGMEYWKKRMYIIFGTSNCSADFMEEIRTWAQLNVKKYRDIFVPGQAKHLDGKMESVYYNRNHIRQKFLETDAEYVFFIDADVAMEPRTIRRLIDICELEGADISAGTYMYKTKHRPKPMLFETVLPSAEFSALDLRDQSDISSYKSDRTIGLGNFRLARGLMDGGTHIAGACNMGCTMIKRKCLEKIDFKPKTCYGTEDLSWFADAQAAGYVLKVDTGLRNFHLDQNGQVYCWWNFPLWDDKYEYRLVPERVEHGIH